MNWGGVFLHRTDRRVREGFTLVELLIVIIVIAILATLAVVSYNGVRQSALRSSVESSVAQYGQKILSYAAEKGAAPLTLADAGLVSSPTDMTVNFKSHGPASDRKWCIAMEHQGVSFYMDQASGTTREGGCGPREVATMTSLGNMNGAKTVVFVSKAMPTDYVYAYALDLRPAVAGYVFWDRDHYSKSGLASYRIDDGFFVAWAENVTGPVNVGRRYEGVENWPKNVYKAVGYDTNLTQAQIDAAIAEIKSDL